MPSFSKTVTLALIMLMSQITIVFRNENPDTRASPNCTEDPLPE